MRKLVAVAVALFAMPVFAQSAKVTMQMARPDPKALGKPTVLLSSGTYAAPEWTPILFGTIHTSSQKDLVFGVSLVTSLFTDTKVSSSKYRTDTSKAEAMVEVKVEVDGREASPGTVTFDRRAQTLMAEFDGFSCEILSDGTIALDGCAYKDEVLELILDTEAAHAFFFGMNDIGTGTHNVVVYARTMTESSSQAGAAKAQAVVGKAAMTVEEVRLVNGDGVDLYF